MNSIKKSLSVATKTTGDVVSDVLTGMLKAITTTTTGVEHFVAALGKVVAGLGADIKVVAHHTATGAGNFAETVANGLGDVIEKIPVAGKPIGFVVSKAGTSIKYLVVSVSDLVGGVSTSAGKGIKAGSKVIVYTLGQGQQLTGTVVQESNKLVGSVLGRVDKLSGIKTRKTLKNRK
jgi:hypothetical protein